MKYSEIKTLDDLEKAQEQVKDLLGRKGEAVRDSFIDMRESYAPANLLLSGLRTVSSFIPFDQLLLTAVRLLKRRMLG